MAEAQTTIDIFPHLIDGGLDGETRLRLHDFASRYRRFGQGRVTLLAPIGGPGSGLTQRELDSVRRALAAEGLGEALFVSTYPVKDVKLASPMRVYFTGIKAQVAGKCGEWPDDLASASSLDGWQNRTYWNYGCATQATLAAQIADPRDLVTPRGETPQDVETRMRAITALRSGGLSK
jgi:pilus assembly protein CpaD